MTKILLLENGRKFLKLIMVFALVLTSCDLSEKVEFLTDGSAVIEDKDEVSGSCVLNPLPTGFVTKWAKISTNQYKLIIEDNGTLAFEQ